MIRITTSLDTEVVIKALKSLPKEDFLDFTRDLLVEHRDSELLEEVADMVLAELERRASGS